MSTAVGDPQPTTSTVSSTANSAPAPEGGSLKRSLERRHITMIALGGAIGTGLFLASGQAISQAGPGGAIIAYALTGIMVFFLMQSLGEMAAYIPVSGSFEEYGRRFVSPSFGFATGWNYWFNWAITVAAELSASAIVMKFWFPHSPTLLWPGIFLALLVVLNILSVRGYGEAEFWFASIKVVTVIVFLAVGVLMILGVFGAGPGARHWTEGQAPFVNGFGGIFSVLMVAGFSFQGTEMLGIAAGETDNPEKNIPHATRSIFWRILLFYIGAIAVIGTILSYKDPNLLRTDVTDVAVSTFTLVFQRVGLAAAAAVMNAVILTSVLSAGNSGLYVSSRMLQALAAQGSAPRPLARISRHGVPVPSLVVTVVLVIAFYLSSLIGSGEAYYWLLSASGLAGFITWIGIAWCHIKFRRAFLAQGHALSELPYRALLFPAGPIIALVMCVLVIIGQGYLVISDSGVGLDLLSSYIGLPLFLALWGGHKLATKAPAVAPEEADLTRGAVPAEPEAAPVF